jgi:glycerophosphoryl diester phosphodiesterase
MSGVSHDGEGRGRERRGADRTGAGRSAGTADLGCRPLIIGHRGFPARHPDDTLAGIDAALGVGADGVEVDVRPCADGVWVCHHDRTRGGELVARWELAALRHVAVPTLAEVVAAVPNSRWLFVEVKPLPVAKLVMGLGELRRVLGARATTTRFLSSSLALLAHLGEALPAIARSWVVGELPASPPPKGVGLSPRHTLVERVLGWGVELHPWTVDRPARMRALAQLGVASLTSNRPDLAVGALRG